MEWKHCLLSKGGQLQCRRKNKMFFCIIIQRKVINLRNTTNNICVSVSSDITDWDTINWYSVEKYVDKQQKRIYEAEVNKESNLAEDKGLLEPSVVKATRWVLRRV